MNVAVPPLDDELAAEVLQFLGCRHTGPSIRALDRLAEAYVDRVPWETVFRILKRSATTNPEECPRLPAEFWHDALEFGGGGTCYENNYAFMSLLSTLGYSGYMTVNDFGTLRGNHAAGIVTMDGRKYIVDVSIPIPRTLLLDPFARTRRRTPLHDFMVTPLGKQRYQVSRTRHPKRDVYVLIDRPVANGRFREVMTNDYGSAGQFLDCVRIVKTKDGLFWRYNQGENPSQIEGFGVHGRTEINCANGSLAETLASHFQMDVSMVRKALARASSQ